MSGFEVYRKQRHPRDAKPVVVASPNGVLRFRVAAMPLIEGVTHVQMLWDDETHRAALRPATAADEAAYSVTRHPSQSQALVHATLFTRLHQLAGEFELVRDGELLIMEPA
ncbi:MAG: hypothetical protein AB7T06_40780 [Kofleriaceae bacterium]